MERTSDRGFTLIELLIVIVILGILATVVVFAVGGISDRGQDATCANTLRVIGTAQEADAASHSGSYVDEAALVADNLLRDDSDLYDLTVAGDGSYTIAPATGSACTQTVTNAKVPAAAAVIPTGIMFGTFPAWEYGPGGNDEILVLGRTQGASDWMAMINAAPQTSRRATFINLDEVSTTGDVDYILGRSRTNGDTAVAMYLADDTIPITSPSSSLSVDAYLSNTVGSDPYHHLDPPGTSIEDLVISIG